MVSIGERESSTTYLSARFAFAFPLAFPALSRNEAILVVLVSGVSRVGMASIEPR